MALSPGTKFGRYEIVSAVGAGGMGEVYRARDTRLDRTVAIKVLPAHLSSDAGRRQRFEREAKAISSLNHPHICILHDIGTQGGIDFLVLEYLEGETLAHRLKRGPLPTQELLNIAAEVSDALDKAHRQGVIHRDLKPANIMLIPHGGTKLLDFGLAKPVASPATAALTAMATESQPLTAEGAIVGTFQYMAPEQLEGKEAEARSDIFSFGAVLYEMATGKKAFEGKTTASVIAAVLASEPTPISALQPMTPPVLERVVKKCLAKDADERWQSAKDLHDELRWITEGGIVAPVSPPATVGAHRAPLQWAAWALAGGFLVAAAFGIAAYLRLARTRAEVIVAEITPPEKATFNFRGTTGGPPVLSPDGRALAFVAIDAGGKNMIWVRPLGASSARRVEGSEESALPFWSEDGRSIGFVADGKLKTIDVSGGPPLVVADAPLFGGGTWNRQGIILFVSDARRGLFQVAASGGTPTPVLTLDPSRLTFYLWPQFLPDGKHFIYLGSGTDTRNSGIYFASLDGRENRLVLRLDNRAVYSLGFLLYGRGTTLMAQAFDPESGQPKGEAHPVAQQVSSTAPFSLDFGVSENGILAYQAGGGEVAGKKLVWFDRSGKKLGAIEEVGAYYNLRLSPDGRKLAFSLGDPNSEIWVDELARGARMRLTFDPTTDRGMPLWSPDGTQILFCTLRGGKAKLGIYRKPSNGAGAEELLLASDTPDVEVWATDWSRDGRFIIYSRGDLVSKSRGEIWVLPLVGDRKPRQFLQTPIAAYEGQFSGDGRWVAYTSKESGGEQVYVVPFDAARFLKIGNEFANPTLGGKWQISTGGGRYPRWRLDGKEIFYLAPDYKLMAAEVGAKGNSFQVGAVRPLFSAAPEPSSAPYDVSPDGKRFIIVTTGGSESRPITLVVNWTSELKQ